MGLFDLKEHTSCYNYSKNVQEGESHEKEMDKDHILFVFEGALEFTYNHNETSLLIQTGKMICFRCDSTYTIRSLKPSRIVIALFENTVQSCEHISLDQLYNMDFRPANRTNPFEIRHNLYLFLELMICYLEDGANCYHFHEIKLREMFWNLRFYYTKTEQATFLHPILGKDRDFRKTVLDNYKNARTVKELAFVCGLSLSSFKRRFSNEFREPVNHWIEKQMNKIIKNKLADENIPLGEIAFELEFSSLPQFSRYCKRNFGYAPGEYRKIMKERRGNV